MAKRYTDEFRRDAVRMATTSGLTRPQLSSDLGVGLSTLNKWVQQHQHDDLMSGPHEDVEKENRRLRKEVRLLREEMSLDILGVQIANGSKNPDDEHRKNGPHNSPILNVCDQISFTSSREGVLSLGVSLPAL